MKAAHERAILRDRSAVTERDALHLPSPKKLFSGMRARLLEFANNQDRQNDIFKIVQLETKSDISAITLGPPFDKGPVASHLFFDSGARLSFGVTVRDKGTYSTLVSYRYHYVLPASEEVSYIRFDLNADVHGTPTVEPLAHLHPGLEHVRLPSVIFDPLNALDVILEAIERGVKAL